MNKEDVAQVNKNFKIPYNHTKTVKRHSSVTRTNINGTNLNVRERSLRRQEKRSISNASRQNSSLKSDRLSSSNLSSTNSRSRAKSRQIIAESNPVRQSSRVIIRSTRLNRTL